MPTDRCPDPRGHKIGDFDALRVANLCQDRACHTTLPIPADEIRLPQTRKHRSKYLQADRRIEIGALLFVSCQIHEQEKKTAVRATCTFSLNLQEVPKGFLVVDRSASFRQRDVMCGSLRDAQ